MSALTASIGPLGQSASAAAGDADVAAFLAATSISNGTQVAAVTQLVADLKAAAVWTKLHALYPFVGGTASAHKFNLIDPRDLDAAYRLTFSGTWTHGAVGGHGDGTAAYADTHLAPTTVLGTTGGFGVYVTVDPGDGGANMYDMAVDDGDINPLTCISMYHTGTCYTIYGDSGFTPSASISTALGLTAVNRRGASTQGWRNGSQLDTATPVVTMPSASLTLYLGADNRNGAAAYWSNKTYAASFVADALSPQNEADLYTAVQAYQTTLGRQV